MKDYVYIVMKSSFGNDYIDSVWNDKDKALKRKKKLSNSWIVCVKINSIYE